MAVDHTAALPPNHGRIALAASGWTRKSKNAPAATAKAAAGTWTPRIQS